jgi:phospholipid N-methyltransferase
MVPKTYLTGFDPTVSVSGGTYIVDYGIGECVYTYRKVGRRIKQDVLQLIKCDMWKVIESINMETPLNEGDYKNLNMEIRNHSLGYVENYLTTLSLKDNS